MTLRAWKTHDSLSLSQCKIVQELAFCAAKSLAGCKMSFKNQKKEQETKNLD